jgi:membrane protease YdiL (CAAX protease family)
MAEHAGWPGGRPRALGLLPRFLFDDRGPRWRYVLLAWPVVALPALALAWIASRLAPGLAGPELKAGPAWLAFVGVVLVSPLLETLLMTGLVALMARVAGPVAAVVGSAALWGAAHSLVAARWGLVVWWPFLLFSIAYLTWRHRGYWQAVGVVTAIHVLQNAAPMVALLVLD